MQGSKGIDLSTITTFLSKIVSKRFENLSNIHCGPCCTIQNEVLYFKTFEVQLERNSVKIEGPPVLEAITTGNKLVFKFVQLGY